MLYGLDDGGLTGSVRNEEEGAYDEGSGNPSKEESGLETPITADQPIPFFKPCTHAPIGLSI